MKKAAPAKKTNKKTNMSKSKNKSGSKEGKDFSLPADRCVESRNWVIGGARRSPGSDFSSSRLTPKWSRNGSGGGFRYCRTPEYICTGETYRTVVKYDLCRGRLAGGPVRHLQFQPRRQHQGAPSISMRATRLMKRR